MGAAMQIDISFRTWQQLTALLQDENDSHDSVIARLLAGKVQNRVTSLSADLPSGLYCKDAFLPNGTRLRATYRGQTFFGEVIDGKWIDIQTGETRTSPSQAAAEITRTANNGWLFWKFMRPEDSEWKLLLSLRKSGARQ